MPNIFAQLAVLCWPIVALFLYRKYTALTATFWTIFGAYMFLPLKVSYEFPLIPNIEKENVAVYSALIGCFAIKKIPFKFIPGSFGARALVFIGLTICTFTVLTNLDPVFTGMTLKPGLQPKDLISMTFQTVFTLVPFILGAMLVRNIDEAVSVLRLIVIAGIIYSPFMVIEVMLSPQLHTWIYGFFPRSFNQQVRFDGYRPVVFMGHGLLVAIFTMAVLIATTGLWKAKQKIFLLPNTVYVIYMLAMLVICKSVGAWLLGFLGFIILFVAPISVASTIAFAIAVAVFSYPILSIFNIIPHDSLLDLAAMFGPEKVGSLAFRFEHEEVLLAHGQEKMLFGWGGWGRNRIDGAITDGFWIIRFTQFGLLGYLVSFGIPLLAVKNGQKYIFNSRTKLEKRVALAYCMLIALIMVDQIPNASLKNWVWFIYGAATGLFAASTVRVGNVHPIHLREMKT
ncbi:hypothetical protein PVT68_10765 [Microbulbifer bruguierae]|uniref:Uncharacterized protein n=1 Tax=Microbulbifer bruguierae TaxID=3029061 RepID=A0ABY8N9G4_9GAMM|nr:hypothetical protein [Microbulbifer bruguierae]WGL15252.1 hypothetical protein PVT68_10765 [Microbulbifer bruguierae]